MAPALPQSAWTIGCLQLGEQERQGIGARCDRKPRQRDSGDFGLLPGRVGQPFSRGIEVQVLDGRNSEVYTSHGDVFSIWGASMKPDRPHPRGSERCLPSE